MNKTTKNIIRCDGCSKFCELGAYKYSTQIPVIPESKITYMPTFDGTVITAYVDQKGKTTSIKPCATPEAAIELAKTTICVLCTKHKDNVK